MYTKNSIGTHLCPTDNINVSSRNWQGYSEGFHKCQIAVSKVTKSPDKVRFLGEARVSFSLITHPSWPCPCPVIMPAKGSFPSGRVARTLKLITDHLVLLSGSENLFAIIYFNGVLLKCRDTFNMWVV